MPAVVSNYVIDVIKICSNQIKDYRFDIVTLDPRINYKLLRLFRYAGNKYLLTMSRRTKSNALFSSVGTSYCSFKTMNLLLACKYVYNIRVSMLLPSFWTVLSTLHVYCSPGFMKEVACFFRWTAIVCLI